MLPNLRYAPKTSILVWHKDNLLTHEKLFPLHLYELSTIHLGDKFLCFLFAFVRRPSLTIFQKSTLIQ
ncbi:hypothetical protein RIF29_05761 [Crotalaria pallida]|uniref:Uncharacterized protein n=1 Tax=Crotalaria pallida TaxID=3830 RepID=A0AAN9J2E3_CROPI